MSFSVADYATTRSLRRGAYDRLVEPVSLSARRCVMLVAERLP